MKVLGFNEEITTCDRCGKSELKGTWEVENFNGESFRLGTSCIQKKFELEASEAKGLISDYKKKKKNDNLYKKHIKPIKEEMKKYLEENFYSYDSLSENAKKMYNEKEKMFNNFIEQKAKNKKITL